MLGMTIKGVYVRLLAYLATTLLLAGCAASSSGYYTQSIKSWRGGNIKELVKVWGNPYSTMTNLNGNTVYVYKRQSSYRANTNYSPSIGLSSRMGGVPVITSMPDVNAPWNHRLTSYCLASFIANQQGLIIDTDIQGTNCYISQSNATALKNPKSVQR